MQEEVLSRRDAVRRIAIRAGWSEQSAEDIAQEAALQLLANPNLRAQRATFAYIDSVRSGGEGYYRRSGGITQPVYESAFEDYSDLINRYGSVDDIEERTIARSDLFDVVHSLEALKQNHRLALELYCVEGLSMDQISKRLGCTVSRVSQLIKFSRIELKKAVISSRLSRQKQRKRKWEEQNQIPRKIQERSRIQTAVSFTMESFPVKTIEGLVSFKIPKVPQALFTSF